METRRFGRKTKLKMLQNRKEIHIKSGVSEAGYEHNLHISLVKRMLAKKYKKFRTNCRRKPQKKTEFFQSINNVFGTAKKKLVV